MNPQVLNVIVIPSYNETLALPELLRELISGLSGQDAVIVMDDSPEEISKQVERKCLEAVQNSNFEFKFNGSGLKSGRGAAVRRGMALALSEFPNVEAIHECDADGSHRPEDILRIKNSSSEADLLVGSRYLKSSRILGWPVTRRVFSWFLNRYIPRLIGIELKDITNGLRRYSKAATIVILTKDPVNTGFIYLSEQALLISRADMVISEESIVFIDRTLGKSTVTRREISDSLHGMFKLVLANRTK